MAQDSIKDEYEVIADLGVKIGIPNLSMQDFDLVFADAEGVDKYCDQFEALEITPAERFHFMQLIVASLDLALDKRVPGFAASEQRVERTSQGTSRLQVHHRLLGWTGIYFPHSANDGSSEARFTLRL